MTIETKQANWVPQLAALNVAALIDHIVSRYHEIHRQELPELLALARKVERVHHDVPEAPLGLADVLERLSAELEHTHAERRIRPVSGDAAGREGRPCAADHHAAPRS